MKSIQVYDLNSGKTFEERVFGGFWVKLLYQCRFIRRLLLPVFKRRGVSAFFGAFQSSTISRFRISAFVRKYGIRMDEYGGAPYRSFNDFFARPFKEGARVFCSNQEFPAPAEARYLAFESVNRSEVVGVKGELFSLEALITHPKWCEVFDGGPVLIARLCPVDYHRFHFPDAGRFEEFYRLHGAFNSVNPWAIESVPKILSSNERAVSILDTEHFGKLAYIEVGAMMVGKIVQTHLLDRRFRRGDEKGYFHFGASTVVVVGERGRWSPDAVIIKNSAKGVETYAQLGQRIGHAPA